MGDILNGLLGTTFHGKQWAVIAILLFLLMVAVASMLLAVFSSLAQRRYDRDVLPSLPGLEEEEEGEQPAPEEESVFAFDSLVDEKIGDREADALLEATHRAQEKQEPKARGLLRRRRQK